MVFVGRTDVHGKDLRREHNEQSSPELCESSSLIMRTIRTVPSRLPFSYSGGWTQACSTCLPVLGSGNADARKEADGHPRL